MVMPADLFDRLVLFQDLTPRQHDLLRSLFVFCELPVDHLLFEQGDAAEYLYVLVEGEVLVRYKPDDGPALTVARVRPEGVVGWSAALGSPAYTSGAMCSTECQMLRVRGQDLRDLCERDPETGTLVLERLAAMVAERLRNTHNHIFALLEQGLRTGAKSQDDR